MSEVHELIDWGTYLDVVSAAIGLPVPAAHREATVAQLKLNVAIAAPLLAFGIPEGTDLAGVFRP
jgi:uncharacterized membrane protein (DUF2068 family)